ncbi:MAG: iron export ABC transporter permease subunit FetB [Syntrophomonadaceae bacterium]|nr:iron export ABC transporter permease subunit FetB [Syntrophomonadaceae bacterium]MDD3890057.1 iron export ABC transporter permease subunit FetB [Syntrophomonadaceae bacterium]MDD4548430.1 iron export ABC transporter permease subunit FetB [Syntrophomonadaceae bacterium]
MNNYTYIPISNLQLAFSVLLVLITGLISALLKLGLLKSLIWGTIRAFVQLTLIGYVLTYIFALNNLIVIAMVILFMCFVASREATRRVKNVPHHTGILSFLSLSASTFVVGLIVVIVIISPQPWYSPQVVIPIFGMLLGNSMNAIALSLDRMYSEVHSHIDEVEQLLCFGATPWESVLNYIKNAVAAGMTPTINSLMVVGLVSLPGMMTGQILAGMNPQSAVRYQFIVMVMIAASVAIGCLLIVGLSYKKMFNEEMALVDEIRKN